jgi:lysophospholipase L1-like esterase
MNPLALYLASGESLYPGALLLLALLPLRFKNPWLGRLRSLFLWIALALMVLACAPFPLWLQILFGCTFLAWLATPVHPGKTTPARRRLHFAATLILAFLTLLLPALEFPHRFLRPLPAGAHTRLTIIGDSLSSGLGDRILPWPDVFTRTFHIPTTNLSRPGIGAEDALPLAQKLTPSDTLLLLEVGGNDLIANLPAADFERNLRALLQAAAAPNRTLVMFELPLLPHKIAYGRIQRRLAAEFHVVLLPKRFLIQVLSEAGATSDGLHLSPTGAAAMAAFVHQTLSPCF